MKQHEFRELVNELRDTAIKYHASQELRERIVHVLWAYEVFPERRNQGLGVAALREIQAHFPKKVLKPIDILETAEGFWSRMANLGLVAIY